MKFTTTLLTSALLLASFTSAEIQPRAAGQVGHHSKVARSNSVAEKAARRAIIDADLEEREEAAQALAPKKRGCKAKSSKSKSKSSSSNSSSKSTDKEASKGEWRARRELGRFPLWDRSGFEGWTKTYAVEKVHAFGLKMDEIEIDIGSDVISMSFE